MRKVIAIMMLFLLCLSLVACGAKQNDGESGMGNSENSAEVQGSNNNGEIVYVEPISHSGNIPDGGEYRVCVSVTEEDDEYYCQYGSTLAEGAAFPSTPNVGDQYIFGDYTYTYRVRELLYTGDALDEWSVIVNDVNKTEYGAILSSINGKPVTTMDKTFSHCVNMVVSPVIPDSVTTMLFTYHGCTSLKYIKNLPDSVVSLEHTFYECSSLEASPELPSALEDMFFTFHDCESLLVAPQIPETVDHMQGTFSGCASLKQPPVIPNGVEGMKACFADCVSLETAPVIPESVDNLALTFSGCSALSGEIVVNCVKLDNCQDCFAGVDRTMISITGSASPEIVAKLLS